jgi:hypothetical protein
VVIIYKCGGKKNRPTCGAAKRFDFWRHQLLVQLDAEADDPAI